MGTSDGDVLLLQSSDFDLFVESGRRSKREETELAARRADFRQRLAAWASLVSLRLERLGFSAELVQPEPGERAALGAGDGERVIFLRDAFSRAIVPGEERPHAHPLRSHAQLTLALDAVHAEVAFLVYPEAESDAENFRRRLEDPAAILGLTSLLETLPEEFSIGVLGVPSFPRAAHARTDELRALLDDSKRSGRALWLGWSVKREVALAHADSMGEELADALVALAYAYRLAAWAPDNDFLGSRSASFRDAGQRGARKRASTKGEAPSPREEGRTTRKTGRKAVRTQGTRREREGERRPRPASDEGAPPGSTKESGEDTQTAVEGARPLLGTNGRRPILSSTGRARVRPVPVTEVDPKAPIERGARVLVLAGPFTDKVGVVQEVDASGRARVRLGLLAATMHVRDLIVSSEGTRPRLMSSHRRPARAR